MREPDQRFLRYIGEYRLPFPAAVYARLHFTTQTPHDQVGSILASTEWIVAILNGLTSSTLSSYEHDDGAATTLIRGMSKQTLGQSLDRLKKSLRTGQDWSERHISSSIGGLPAWWDQLEAAIAPLASIVEVRNQLIHGGPLLGERAAEALVPLEASYMNLLDQCSFFGELECIVTTEGRRVPRSSLTDIDIKIVTGCNPLFESHQLRVGSELDPETVYLVDRESAIAYALYPYVVALARGAPRVALSISFALLDSASTGRGTWMPLDLRGGLDLFTANDEQVSLASRITAELDPRVMPPTPAPAVLSRLAGDSLNGRSGALPAGRLPDGFDPIGLLRQGHGVAVWQATQRESGILCALKILAASSGLDNPSAAKIEREVEVLTRLKGSAHVVRLVEHGRAPTGTPYLATEYIGFGSVEEWVRQRGPVKWSDTLLAIEGLARGLVEVHSIGVLHRDISMKNVIVRSISPFDVVLADFGTAVADYDPRFTARSDQVGTPDFMAPELLTGRQDSSVQSDIYAVGAVAVGMLTATVGRPSVTDIEGLPIPPAAAETLYALLSEIPENRPPTADALLSRILRLKAGELQVLSPTPALMERGLGTWVGGEGDSYRRIPSGKYLMGGTLFPNETPVHEVEIPEPLLVGTTTVTNAQFGKFIKETRYRSSSRNFLLHMVSGGRGLPSSWRHPQAPAVFVSWADATEYCLWRSESEGLDYRLLSEAEWEYACRAGTRTRYYWGNTFDLTQVNCGQRHDGPMPVGSYDPNPWGLFDMLGNVWEWTRDRLDVVTKERSLFYTMRRSAPAVNEAPANDGIDIVASTRVPRNHRVGRGGSWFSNDRNMRPANRRGEHESTAPRAFGFRLCVRGVPDNAIAYD